MIFNINSGGGVAKLTVRFPAGSTVSISCNGLTLYAKNGASDTQYTFLVPFAGEWIITIVTSDGVSTTQTVTVTPGGNQSTAPTIKYYIFDKGHTYSEITGGWTKFRNDYGSCDINTSYPNGYVGYSNGGDVSGSVGTAQAFTIPAWAKWFKGIGVDYPQSPYGGSVAPYWFMSLTSSKSGNALVTISSSASTKAISV